MNKSRETWTAKVAYPRFSSSYASALLGLNFIAVVSGSMIAMLSVKVYANLNGSEAQCEPFRAVFLVPIFCHLLWLIGEIYI